MQQFRDAVSACPEATVTAPRLGTLTVALRTLDAPAPGDRAAAVRVTATTAPADGQPVTAPALVGLVQDVDRLVTLLSGGPGAAPDADTFLALLEQAYEHQAATLDRSGPRAAGQQRPRLRRAARPCPRAVHSRGGRPQPRPCAPVRAGRCPGSGHVRSPHPRPRPTRRAR